MFVNGGVSLSRSPSASATPRRGERNGERDNKQRRLLRGCRRARSNGYGARCLLDRGKIVDGTPVYLFTGYRVAFGIATVAGFAALACTLDSPDSTAKIALCDQRTDS